MEPLYGNYSRGVAQSVLVGADSNGQQSQPQQHALHSSALTPSPSVVGICSSARLPVRVRYLLSSQWSTGLAVMHFFCVELKKGSFGVPSQRVVGLVDEAAFEMDFDAGLRRCVQISRVEVMHLMPRDIRALEGQNVSSPYSGNTSGDSLVQQVSGAQEDPQQQERGQPNDIDLFLQQSEAKDFMRTLGALYRPNLPGGSPPLLELEEGQPLGSSKANCRLRQNPLKTALVDGVSREALNAMFGEHNRHIRVLRERWAQDRAELNTESVDHYSQREALQEKILGLEQELATHDSNARHERDRMRMEIAQLQEDLYRAREEIKGLKLSRVGAHPQSPGGNMTPVSPTSGSGWHYPTGGSPHQGRSGDRGLYTHHMGGGGRAAAGGPVEYPHPLGPLPPPAAAERSSSSGSNALSRLRSEVEASEAYLAQLRGSSRSSPGPNR